MQWIVLSALTGVCAGMLASLVGFSTIFAPVRLWLRSREARGLGERPTLVGMLECPFCFCFWANLALFVALRGDLTAALQPCVLGFGLAWATGVATAAAMRAMVDE